MKKQSSVYQLTRSSVSETGKMSALTISLTIDYANKKYWVTSNKTDKSFVFASNQNERTAGSRFRAILDMIQEATIFAEKELFGIVPTSFDEYESESQRELEDYVKSVDKFTRNYDDVTEKHEIGVLSFES